MHIGFPTQSGIVIPPPPTKTYQSLYPASVESVVGIAAEIAPVVKLTKAVLDTTDGMQLSIERRSFHRR